MVTIDSMLASYLFFGIVLVRCSGLAVYAPFFGSEYFPLRARIGLVVFFALLMFPYARQTAVVPTTLGATELGLLVLQELTVGLSLGFLSSLVFMGAQLGGQLIGQQVGFAMANVIDPTTDEQVSLIGFLQMNLALLVFLVAGLHLAVVNVLKFSYEQVGIGTLVYDRFAMEINHQATCHMNSMFLVSLRLAMPVLLVMLLNSVVEGFITRTMPQMNIMVLGLPLRVALGMTALMCMMPAMLAALEDALRDMAKDLESTVYSLHHAMS